MSIVVCVCVVGIFVDVDLWKMRGCDQYIKSNSYNLILAKEVEERRLRVDSSH